MDTNKQSHDMTPEDKIFILPLSQPPHAYFTEEFNHIYGS